LTQRRREVAIGEGAFVPASLALHRPRRRWAVVLRHDSARKSKEHRDIELHDFFTWCSGKNIADRAPF